MLTQERAKSVIAVTPFGGNYSDHMTTAEYDHVRQLWLADPSDWISFAAIVRRIAAGEAE